MDKKEENRINPYKFNSLSIAGLIFNLNSQKELDRKLNDMKTVIELEVSEKLILELEDKFQERFQERLINGLLSNNELFDRICNKVLEKILTKVAENVAERVKKQDDWESVNIDLDVQT